MPFLTPVIIAWISFAITVASTIYQRERQRKLASQAADAADKQKGFQLTAEGQVAPLNVFYGRNKVGGTRVFHKVSGNYYYGPPTAGGTAFTTKGNATYMSRKTSLQIQQMSMYLPDNFDGHGSAAKSGVVVTGVGASLDATTMTFTIPANSTIIPLIQAGADNAAGYITLSHTPLFDFDMNVASFHFEGSIGELEDHNYRILSYDAVTRKMVVQLPFTVSDALSTGMAKTVTNTKNEFLFIQQVIGYKGINKIYSVDINGQDYRDPSFGDSGRIHVYTDGNVSDNMMAQNFAERSKAYFTDAAYASMVFRLNRDDPQYNGIPEVQFYIEGQKIYRVVKNADGSYGLSATRTYSNTPSLCLLDYLLNSAYGKGVPLDKIDLESFYHATTICERLVPVNGSYGLEIGGKLWETKSLTTTRTIQLYECNMGIDTSKTIRDNIDVLLETMGRAELVWSGGKYKLQLEYPMEFGKAHTENKALVGVSGIGMADGPGAYHAGDIVQYPPGYDNTVDLYRSTVDNNVSTPGVSNTWVRNVVSAYLSDDDILKDEAITQTWPSSQNKLNFYTVRFNNEAKDFAEDSVSWPPKNGDNGVYLAYLAEDNNQQLEGETFQSGDTTYYHALATAEEKVRASRSQVVYKFGVSTEFSYLEPGDFIKINSEVLNIDGELLQIEEISVEDASTAVIQAVKYDARNLAWNAKDNEVVRQRNVYDSSLDQASNLVFTPVTSAQPGIDSLSSGILSWVRARDTRVRRYSVKVTQKSLSEVNENTEWLDLGSTDGTTMSIPILQPGYFTFTVVAMNDNGVLAPFYNPLTGSTWPLLNANSSLSALGLSTASLSIYMRSKTKPPTPKNAAEPFGGTYDFLTSVMTSLPADWSTVVPEGEDSLYISNAMVTVRYPDTLCKNITWSDPKAFYLSGIETHVMTAYARGAPTKAPTGGSYTFPAGTAANPLGVPPTSDDGTTWAMSDPGGAGALWSSVALASGPHTGLNTNQLVWSTPTVMIQPNDLVAEVYMYVWGPIAPNVTAGKTKYTWGTGSHTVTTSVTGANSVVWSLDVPTNSNANNIYLYRAKKRVVAPSGSVFTDIDWTIGVTIEQISKEGVPGLKTANLKAYQWALSAPTVTATPDTYNWTTKAAGAVPTGWALTAPAAPSPGFTLWTVEVVVTESTTVNTTAFNWNIGRISAAGYAGLNGSSLNTWVMYSDNSDGSGMYATPTTTTLYIGIAVNQASATKGTNPASYTWSKFKGDQGVKGDNMYTWIKYADSSAGAGLSDDPTGKTYIGMAFNKITATESTVATDYVWSLIKGGDGAKGDSYRTCYAKTTASSMAGTPATVTTAGSSSFPAVGTWSTGATWSANPPALAAGESLYQSDGVYSTSTGNTIWTVPYLSSLKVGSLNAITTNTGDLTVTGTLSSGNGNFSTDSTGKTVIRSASTGDRTELSNDGIIIYAAGAIRIRIGKLI
jgi:hypothetical protein